MPAPIDRQLLLYRFGPDSSFEGALVGALERLESGGTMRVREALFVRREPATGELVAVDVTGDGAGSMVAPLLDFRLDERAREAATRRALEGDTARYFGEDLEPGEAVAAVLVEHVWAQALDDAATRSGGTRVVAEFVEAEDLAGIRPRPAPR